jgi:hypothetical protein
MIGLGIANMMGNFDADTKLWLAQCGTRPSNEVVSAVDTFIRQCKVDGNWQLLDRFWLFGQDVQANARISIKNPSATQITEVNAPTFTANQGYDGNGSTQYLRSAFIPSVDGVNYTLNSACLFTYFRTNVGEAKYDMGVSNASNSNFSYIISRSAGGFGTNNFFTRVNNLSSAYITWNPVTDSRGLSVSNRTTSADMQVIKNGVTQTTVPTGTQTPQGLATVEMYVLAWNSNGTANAAMSTKQIAVAGVGSGAIDHLKFYVAVQSLATSIGFQV